MPGTSNSGGRNAKGAQLHVVQGTFRPGRHAGSETPEPPKGTPDPPKALTGEAKAEWKRMVDRLAQNGTLSIVDDAALYQYVELYAETEAVKTDNANVRKLSKELKAAAKNLEGMELVQAIGEIVKLQQILAKQTQQLRQGHMAIRQYLVEFGMTPSARSRVKVAPGGKPVVDPKKEKFFGGSGARA